MAAMAAMKATKAMKAKLLGACVNQSSKIGHWRSHTIVLEGVCNRIGNMVSFSLVSISLSVPISSDQSQEKQQRKQQKGKQKQQQ